MNPLLNTEGLTPFNEIKPEHVAPAIDTLLEQCRAAVERVTAPATPATWSDVVEPLDDATERLSRAWGAVSHLNAVADTPELRAAYNAAEPKLTAFWTELAQNLALFNKYKQIAAAPEFSSWSAARQRLVQNELRDFRLGGAELPPQPKARYGEIQERKSALSTRFAENALDAINAFALYVTDETELDGVPADALAMYREAAAAEGKPGFKLTLQYPSYLPLMQYARNRNLREQMYRAWVTRNSELAQPQWDNSALMVETLQLRREQAQLLDLPDYAALSLQRKMADSSTTVLTFLRDLATRARPHAEQDLAQLREFAARELQLPTPARTFHQGRGSCADAGASGVAREGRSPMPVGIGEHLSANQPPLRRASPRSPNEPMSLCALHGENSGSEKQKAHERGRPDEMSGLEAWDVMYASERLREQRYAYSENELKQYFTLPAVLKGLFHVIETLFNVRIQPDSAPVWHPDVSFYRVQTQAGELVGQFYLDLYAREHKQGGAWQDDARSRRRTARGVQTPVSYLTCNFSRPVAVNGKARPALLTHDDVLTLFHEFGHGLHHMLTRVEVSGVSGIRGVEWDAVELPSQFMENFAWEWEVLQQLSAHVDTGEKLPPALFERMIAARNFQSGLQMLRQVELSLLDMQLHLTEAAQSAADLIRVSEAVRREVAVLIPPDWHRGAWSFSHIFAGGYAAGYYSYKWAEVLSADAYELFEEAATRSHTVLDPQAGERFREEILAVGGSRTAMESFIALRGRAPRIDALLRHQGLA